MTSYIELRIAGEVIRHLLAAGFAISVNDNDGDFETHVERSTDAKAIMAALFSPELDCADYCLDCFKDGKPDAEGHSFGFVRLIAGNGVSVISDYSTCLEDVIAPAIWSLANEIDRDEEGWVRKELAAREALLDAVLQYRNDMRYLNISEDSRSRRLEMIELAIAQAVSA